MTELLFHLAYAILNIRGKAFASGVWYCLGILLCSSRNPTVNRS